MSRDGKIQLCGYFSREDAFTVQEVIARVSRKRDHRVTMQEAVAEAVADWCHKHGTTLPGREKKAKGEAAD